MLAGEYIRLYVVLGASSGFDFQKSFHRNAWWVSVSSSKAEVYYSLERFRWRPCHLVTVLSEIYFMYVSEKVIIASCFAGFLALFLVVR